MFHIAYDTRAGRVSWQLAPGKKSSSFPLHAYVSHHVSSAEGSNMVHVNGELSLCMSVSVRFMLLKKES